jgi:hypothetical protein
VSPQPRGRTGLSLVSTIPGYARVVIVGGGAVGLRHLHPAMAPLETPQVKDWGEANRPRVMMAEMDKELAGRRFVAGED